MPTYPWSFAQSFLIFLMIVFVAQSLAAWLRSLVPMPLFFGVFFAGGFALGWLPRDLLLASNMVAVGTIAFNVLVIHSGTMVDLALALYTGEDPAQAVALEDGHYIWLPYRQVTREDLTQLPAQ